MEQFVEVPGCKLYAKSEGSGPPVVLIHAAIVDQRAWDSFVPGLVAAGYQAIRYDLRGFGRSETLEAEYSEGDDLRAVMDAFGVRRVALIGNSRGGSLSLDAAIEMPDRVVAVVTLGSEPRGFEGTTTPLEEELFAEDERLEKAEAPDVDAIVDLVLRVWVDGPGQAPERVPAAIRDYVAQAARPLVEPGHVSGKAWRLNPPANDRLGDITCPVLAVAGGLDITMMAEAANRLAEGAAARAVIWPDVAHMVALEQPDRLLALVTEFLAPISRWS
jgi:pimeloyl-ACP methyl ester carboxylesterase